MLKKIKNLILKNYSTDTAFRYRPVVKILRKLEKGKNLKILEVGSGDIGLTVYRPKLITGIDIYFDEEIKNDLLKKIKIEKIFFPVTDNEFDLTISVDNIEHLHPSDRELFFREMARVTKNYLIIVVPCGVLSQKQDKILDKYFVKLYGRRDRFLSEHIENGLPDEKEILNYLNKTNIGKDAEILYISKLNNLRFRNFYMHCKLSDSRFLKIIYYLLLMALPFDKITNMGQCYRKLFFIKIN